MKPALLLLLASMLWLPWLLPSIAGSVTGTWSGKWDLPAAAGDQPHYMVLQQQGDTVSGTAGPSADQQFDIRDGKAAGDKLTFEVALPDGQVMRFEFKVEGETLTGQAQIEAGGRSMTVKLSAKRVK